MAKAVAKEEEPEEFLLTQEMVRDYLAYMIEFIEGEVENQDMQRALTEPVIQVRGLILAFGCEEFNVG